MIYAIFSHTRQMRALIVFGQKCVRIPLVGNFLCSMFEYAIRIIFASDISCRAIIPRNTIFVHGHDIVIGANVIIGSNCKIFNGVTLGNKNTESWSQLSEGAHDQPQIGSRCVISTGAKILGNIHIGDNCIIGANAVVINDVPSNSLAVGVPAKIIPRKQ